MPLDGLRAIAVLWVFGLHSIALNGFYMPCFLTNISKFFFIIPLLWGDLGVDVFFTLSGFLISFVLFKDIKKYGKIDYFNFIRSRFFRIWPALFGYCVENFTFLLASGNRDWNNILLQVIPPNFFINNFMG